MFWAQSPPSLVSAKVTSRLSSQLSVASSTTASGTDSQDTVVSAGAAVSHVGANSSVTVMVCDRLVEFPQASVAVQVRTSTCVPGHSSRPRISSSKLTDGLASQPSTAPRSATAGMSKQGTVTSSGRGSTNSGAVMSCCAMFWSQLAELSLPQLSVAVAVKVLIKENEPAQVSVVSWSVQVNSTDGAAPPQLSSAVMAGNPRASTLRSAMQSASADTVVSAGHSKDTVGGVSSYSWMNCSNMLALPQSSSKV